MSSIKNFVKITVGLMLLGATASTIYQNKMKQKEQVKAVRVDYGMVGDTIRQNPCGNSFLKIPDSVNVSHNDQFVRTATNEFEQISNNKSIKNTINGTLKAIKTVAIRK